jgi:hypothetical protein
MGVWKNLVDEVAKARIAGQPRPKGQPRNLTEADRIGWADAQDSRESSMKPRTIEDVKALVRNRNPIRWRQLQGDFRWLQKEMKKMGLNPEDARYIL